ncbi:hypothetical protein FVO59_07515 [Microbacterium esteraromaticum]|uniref:Uncharacterized protein n=1 Tax=Microbacterium esteraromaticum TaxID=57043 RepID=A0A7D7WIB6_9MICO|nr:hypothetical protein [Microbacterium esteraromaticum]QMU97090.1 hypothetical protein FVO59_07515 [Microbacterium esteraromaticum]
MTDALPEGWLPTPFGVHEADAARFAAELSRIAAESFPGFIDGDEARGAVAAVIARPRATASTIGRVWHVLGPQATGAVVDLSIAEETDPVPDSPFEFSIPQRIWQFDGGRAVLSMVAPREGVPMAMVLRAQRVDGARTLIADVFDEPAALGVILDDVITLVGGEPRPGADGAESLSA